MSDRSSTDKNDDYQQALQQVIGDEPDAATLRSMLEVLMKRRAGLLQEIAGDEAAAGVKMKKDLAQLDVQIAVLREEAEITAFIEDSVKVGLEMREDNDR